MLDLSLFNSPTGIDNGTNPRSAINLPLTGGLDGGGLGAGSFKRASIAWYFDNANVLQQAAVDEPRFTANGLLLEPAGTNVCLQSRTLDNASWSTVGGGSVTKDQTGIDGVANSAYTLTDNSAVAQEDIRQTVTVPDDSNTHTVSMFIKKDTDISRFPEVQAGMTGGTSVIMRAQLNTKTGDTVKRGDTGGDDTVTAEDWGDWWRLVITTTNNGTGNTALNVLIFPAMTTTWELAEAATTGSVIIDQVQIELDQAFASSPIVTTTIPVTRATEAGVADTSGAQWDLDDTGTLGPNLTPQNGTFVEWGVTSPTGWTAATNGDGEINEDPEDNVQFLNGAGNGLTQISIPSIITPGRRYKAEIVVSNYTSGQLVLWSGSQNLMTMTSNGTHTVYFTADGTNFFLKRGVANSNVRISNAYLYEVSNSLTAMLEEQLDDDLVTNGDFAADTDWVKGSGWTIAAGVADCDGTQLAGSNINQDLGQAEDTTKVYKVTVDITRTAGSWRLYLGDSGFGEADSRSPWYAAGGSYTFYLKQATTGSNKSKIVISGDVDFTGTVDNVVITEVLNDSRGTMVFDYTLGIAESDVTAAQGIASADEAIEQALVSLRSDGNVRVDPASADTYVGVSRAANATHRFAVRWGINTSNVRQFDIAGRTAAGSWNYGTKTDYPGSFDIGTLLLLSIGTVIPTSIKNVQFFSGTPLTDAEIEAL